MKPERLTWKQTFARIRADRKRLEQILDDGEGNTPPFLMFHPSFVCVFLYRISNHFFRGGHKYVARFFWQCNAFVTGADISPPAELGEGLVILSPPGTAIMAKVGRNFTLMPLSGLGSELGRREDIGAGPGLPVVGDDVVMEPYTGVLGPIHIGDRVRITALAVAVKDVPDDTIVEGGQVRFLKRRDLP